jgi:hypothetical protein
MTPLLEDLDSAPGPEREVTRRDKEVDWEAGKVVRNDEYENTIDSPMIRRGYRGYHS